MLLERTKDGVTETTTSDAHDCSAYQCDVNDRQRSNVTSHGHMTHWTDVIRKVADGVSRPAREGTQLDDMDDSTVIVVTYILRGSNCP